MPPVPLGVILMTGLTPGWDNSQVSMRDATVEDYMQGRRPINPDLEYLRQFKPQPVSYDDLEGNKKRVSELQFMLRPGNVTDWNAPDVKSALIEIKMRQSQVRQLLTQQEKQEKKAEQEQAAADKKKEQERKMIAQRAFQGVPLGREFVRAGQMTSGTTGRTVQVPRAGTPSHRIYAGLSAYTSGRKASMDPERHNVDFGKMPMRNKFEASTLLTSLSHTTPRSPQQAEEKKRRWDAASNVRDRPLNKELTEKPKAKPKRKPISIGEIIDILNYAEDSKDFTDKIRGTDDSGRPYTQHVDVTELRTEKDIKRRLDNFFRYLKILRDADDARNAKDAVKRTPTQTLWDEAEKALKNGATPKEVVDNINKNRKKYARDGARVDEVIDMVWGAK